MRMFKTTKVPGEKAMKMFRMKGQQYLITDRAVYLITQKVGRRVVKKTRKARKTRHLAK